MIAAAANISGRLVRASERAKAAHRKPGDVNSLVVDRKFLLHFRRRLERRRQRRRELIGRRGRLGEPVDPAPGLATGTLRSDDESRVLGHDLVRRKIVHAMNELLLVVVASLPRPVQKDHQRILFAWSRNLSALANDTAACTRLAYSVRGSKRSRLSAAAAMEDMIATGTKVEIRVQARAITMLRAWKVAGTLICTDQR